jgi:hypothetical protein
MGPARRVPRRAGAGPGRRRRRHGLHPPAAGDCRRTSPSARRAGAGDRPRAPHFEPHSPRCSRCGCHQRRRRPGAADRATLSSSHDQPCATSRCAAAPRRCCRRRQPHPAPRREGRPDRPQRRRQVVSLFSLLTGRLHADAGDVEMPPRWRMGEVAQDMPDNGEGATDFVLQGDLPLMEGAGGAGQAEAAATATPWPRRTWRWTRPAPSTPRRAPRRCCWAWVFKRAARCAGQQLLRRLAHAAATGARADVPGRPAAAGRAHQPPGPGRAGVAGGLAQALRGHAARHQPRPRVPRRDHRVTVHLDEARSPATAATTPPSRRCAPSAWRKPQAAYGKQQDKIAHLQRFIDRFKAKATKAKQAQSRVKALARMEKLAPVLTAATSSSSSASRRACPTRCWLFELACG